MGQRDLALAKLAAHTWLQIWVFSGHPSVRIGSLVNPSWEGKIYMVRSARLGDSDVSFNALPLFGDHSRFLSSPRGVKLLSTTLAIECIRCNDPHRLETLDAALLEEVVGQEGVNAFHYAAALGNVDCLAVLIRKLGVSSPLLAGPDGKLASGVLCCRDARFPFGNREPVLHPLLHHFGSFGSDALQSLLMSASQFGAPWLVSFVFSRMAELEKGGVDFAECLRYSCSRAHIDCVFHLLEHGADVNSVDRMGGTPLYWASGKGHIDCARLLLEHGANASAGEWPPLGPTAGHGHTDCVRLLLEHGADANSSGPDGETVLMQASKEGHTDCVRLLLEHGADANSSGETVLMEASKKGHTDCVRLLLEHGADANLEDALRSASRNGQTDCVRLLLEHGADVNSVDRMGGTPLYWASGKGHIDCARSLLEHGADANSSGPHGETVLMEASKKGHTDCVRLLLEHGADANLEDALRSASRNGQTDCVRLLLEHGADVNAKDRHGETPLRKAAEKGHTDCVRLLLEHGAGGD